MKSLSSLILAVAAMALVLPLEAFAQTELVVWHAYRAGEKAAFEKVIETFNSSQKEIQVKTLAVPYDAYADKISAAVPRGKGPDVFIYAQDRMGGWVEAGNTIEPIDFYLEDETLDRFIPSTVDAMTYQGTIYGLPLNYKVVTMFYNKKLVTTPPTTSKELVELAKKHTDASTGRYGLAYWYPDFYYHASLMNAFGGGVFDDNRKPVINQAANVKSVEALLGWLEKDKILPGEPTTALITALFNGGKAAIVFNGPWFLGEIKDDVDYGLAPLPTIEAAGGQPMRPWMTVEGVYIAAPSEHKDEAFTLVEYLTDAAAGKVLALEGGQTPANESVYEDSAVAKNETLAAFREQVEVAVPMPNLPEMTMVWSPVTTAMNTIVKGAASPKASLDAAQKDAEERIDNLLN
ncbi:MAG: extracellular solute-binding protein [Acidobacteriota bacterium]